MSEHIIDRHPHRFGWRYWHLDDSCERLISPIIKGEMRTGKSFFESVCTCEPSGCGCGIYYLPDPNYLLSIEEKTAGEPRDREYTAITFGVGTGHVAPDPALPQNAFCADRYTILAIVLYEKSAAAGRLRARYDVNVTQRDVNWQTLRDVELAVRAQLRGVSDRYFDHIAGQPVLPLDDHIADLHPRFFGYRCWLLTDLGGLTTPDGHAQPGQLAPLGVTYTPSAPYARALVSTLERSFPNDAAAVPLAVTYGYASGELTSPDGWTCNTKMYTPLAARVHHTRAHLAPIVSQRYGIPARPTIDHHALRTLEREGRARIATSGTEIFVLDLAGAVFPRGLTRHGLN